MLWFGSIFEFAMRRRVHNKLQKKRYSVLLADRFINYDIDFLVFTARMLLKLNSKRSEPLKAMTLRQWSFI